MARKNPYDAPLIPSLNSPSVSGPMADDQTEVTIDRTDELMPVDDETNFGDIDRVIGTGSSELEAELMDIDPRALAQRLASIEPIPAPPPAPPVVQEAQTPDVKMIDPPKKKPRKLAEDEPTILGGPDLSIDPRELAKQLAAAAKAKLAAANAPAKPEPQTLQEDPAALARRLAMEAKARLNLIPTPASEPEPAPEMPVKAVKDEETIPPLAEIADAAPKKPRKGGGRRGSLADRAPRKAPKRSAAEALRVLGATPAPAPVREAASVDVESEQAPAAISPPAPTVEASLGPVELPEEAPKRKTKPKKRKKKEKAQAAQREPEPEEAAEPVPVPEPVEAELEPIKTVEPEVEAKPETPTEAPPAYLATLRDVLPGVEVLAERPVRRPAVFRALWQAHQTRAAKDGRLELVAASTLLLERVEVLETGDLIGLRLLREGVEWAAFVERPSGLLLAIVARPEIYLAGLQ